MEQFTLHSIAVESGQLIPAKVTIAAQDGIGIHMIGVPDARLKEIFLRVATAIESIGGHLPSKKITIDVAPSLSMKSPASQLDLPVAIGLLALNGYVNKENYEDKLIAGELRLNGDIVTCKCIDALGMYCLAKNNRLKGIVSHLEDADSDTLEVDNIKNLRNL